MQRRTVEGADIAGVGSRNDSYSGRFEQHEVVVSGGPLWWRRNSWKAGWNFIRGYLLKLRPRRDDLGIAELSLDVVQIHLLTENHAIAVLDPQRRYVRNVAVLHEVDKFRVHEPILDAVHQDVSARAYRSLR